MGESYTIRCCRSDARNNRPPTEAFRDKQGRDCSKFDGTTNSFGSSVLLADDGNQLVPGHPNMWEKSGPNQDAAFYLGYDYREFPGRGVVISENRPLKTPDTGAIRRLAFPDGWPSIWTKVNSFTLCISFLQLHFTPHFVFLQLPLIKQVFPSKSNSIKNDSKERPLVNSGIPSI